MRVKDILNIDISDIKKLAKTSPKEVRKLTAQLAGAARKRVKRTENEEIIPPALKSLQRAGGVGSIRGMDLTGVLNEYQKLRTYLNDPYSTLKGAKQFARNTAEKLGVPEATNKELARILEVWGNVKDRYGDVVANAINYEKMLDFVHNEVIGGKKTLAEILSNADEKIRELYETEEAEGGGVSGFFKLQ